MMEGAALAELAEDIKANGLLEPIELYEEKVLDGRNRLKACELAGVAPLFATASINGSSPIAFVISKNLHRRHLTQSQRAAAAAEALPLFEAEAAARMRLGAVHGGETAGNGRHGSSPPPEMTEGNNGRSQESSEIAGKAFGVGRTLVRYAAAIKRADPDAFQQMKRGAVAATAVYARLKKDPSMAAALKPKKKHPAPPREGTKRRDIIENAARRRMIDGLSGMRGSARGLASLDATFLKHMDQKERNVWLSIIREIVTALRGFAEHLKGKS